MLRHILFNRGVKAAPVQSSLRSEVQPLTLPLPAARLDEVGGRERGNDVCQSNKLPLASNFIGVQYTQVTNVSGRQGRLTNWWLAVH